MPLQVEDVKKSLILYGGQTSQVIKDLLTDLHRLKGVSGECVYFPQVSGFQYGVKWGGKVSGFKYGIKWGEKCIAEALEFIW